MFALVVLWAAGGACARSRAEGETHKSMVEALRRDLMENNYDYHSTDEKAERPERSERARSDPPDPRAAHHDHRGRFHVVGGARATPTAEAPQKRVHAQGSRYTARGRAGGTAHTFTIHNSAVGLNVDDIAMHRVPGFRSGANPGDSVSKTDLLYYVDDHWLRRDHNGRRHDTPRREHEPSDNTPQRDDAKQRDDAPQRNDVSQRDDVPQRNDVPQWGNAPNRDNVPQRDDAPRRNDAPQRDDASQQNDVQQWGNALYRDNVSQRDDAPRRNDAPQRDGTPQRDDAPQWNDAPQREYTLKRNDTSRLDDVPQRDNTPQRDDSWQRNDTPQRNDTTTRNNDAVYDEMLADTTAPKVKYKLLKVHSRDPTRRTGRVHRFLQEQGARGVALVSLDAAPFPLFDLPRSRRQYMRDVGEEFSSGSEEDRVPPTDSRAGDREERWGTSAP